ncbi:hypothetical protein PR003_g16817 [Phytophthora rubi]|uniref:Uncharacterized protein n=1 Tax=Phytophthora rubi TaxID=129364 RepID=A0A6A3KRX5_9STRA|nr:hypothetical protein PR002_g16450 [Phytophthora rubi]KAE9007286.1 hypothetical protein PR001_g17001 [Phytophthora rubi]KAE9324105.1 hypothetical protein PR003_g16817 [Phytophthora rubi]
MQPGSRSAFGVAPSSRRSSATADTPLTAERAMMDQIRFKLERAQRRLARNAPSSNSSNNSNYIPSSQYRSAVHKPPVRSVRVEDAVGPPSTLRHHGLPAPPPSSRREPPPPPSSKYQQLKPPPSYAPQYKSRSKYAHGSLQESADPLNGGPPPMSTPYLVYSNTRPPMTGSYHSRTPDTARHRAPPSGVNPPPSALKSRVARPPSSRVRFEGHEDLRASIDKKQEEEEERRRRKEREARHLRHREREINARAKGTGPASPIAAATRGRRSASLEKPPSSAIKASAYEDIAQTIPTSPVGRPRRSSVNNPPPKSDIDVSAFDVLPRRRGAAGQDKAPKPEQKEEAPVDTTDVVETDAEGHSSESDNQETAEQETAETPPVQLAVELPPPSVVPEPNAPSSDEDVDGGGASDSDDSLYERSDFDTDSEYLSSGYSMFNAHVLEVDVQSDSSDEEIPTEKPASSNQESEDEEEDVPPPPASELSTVDEEDDDEEPQPAWRLTARDLAFLALGRASSCSFSDFGSPVSSASGKNSPKPKPAPMSYAPASSAFPRSRAGRPPAPATTGRTRVPPPSSSTSVSSYVRRSRARAPMDLKNQLPPSIGVLSGLSSGSSTFVMDPSCFYDVTWKLGEFAFSVQRVYTEENEFEFDDRNQEPQLFLRMLLNTERSTCKSFRDVRLGDVLIRVGDSYVSDLGLEGSGTVLTKFFAKLTARTPIKLTFQRMCPNDWEGGVEL